MTAVKRWQRRNDSFQIGSCCSCWQLLTAVKVKAGTKFDSQKQLKVSDRWWQLSKSKFVCIDSCRRIGSKSSCKNLVHNHNVTVIHFIIVTTIDILSSSFHKLTCCFLTQLSNSPTNSSKRCWRGILIEKQFSAFSKKAKAHKIYHELESLFELSKL